MLFFSPGGVPLSQNHVFVMAYPPIPWLGIMLVGFASGKFFAMADEARKRLFITIGAVALVLFAAIRAINVYGDSVKWTEQKSAVFSFLSFMNVTKYPPSLQFCLVTLGIIFFIACLHRKCKEQSIKDCICIW